MQFEIQILLYGSEMKKVSDVSLNSTYTNLVLTSLQTDRIQQCRGICYRRGDSQATGLV